MNRTWRRILAALLCCLLMASNMTVALSDPLDEAQIEAVFVETEHDHDHDHEEPEIQLQGTSLEEIIGVSEPLIEGTEETQAEAEPEAQPEEEPQAEAEPEAQPEEEAQGENQPDEQPEEETQAEEETGESTDLVEGADAPQAEGEECMHEINQLVRDVENETYNVKDAQLHTHHIDWHEYRYCNNCGETFDDSYPSEDTEENHEFDAVGFCTKCWYECPHEGYTKERTTIADEWWTDFDDHQHTHTTLWNLDTACPNCGATGIGDNYEEIEVKEPHDFDENGYCSKCYKWCEHEYDNTKADGLCTICGFACPHMFDYQARDGICEICGASCPHDNTDDDYDYEYEYSDDGDERHACTEKRYVFQKCNDCGMEVPGSRTLEYENTYNEAHDYSEGENCSKCGHKNTCQHTGRTWAEYRDKNDRYGNATYATHERMWDEYECIYCRNCGQLLSEEFVETVANDPEQHRFNYDTHICEDCGYECPHTGKQVYERYFESSNYVSYNESTHTQVGKFISVDYCENCGYRYNEKILFDETRSLPHEFNPEGDCGCGYHNPCTHTPEWVITRVTWRVYEDTSAEGHKIIDHTEQTLRCTSCGQDLDYRIDELVDRGMAPHVWDRTGRCRKCNYWCEHAYNSDGVCTICGKICRHENVKEEMDNRYVYTDESDNNYEHLTTCYQTTKTICEECGKVLESVEEETYSETEQHSYENHVCTLCGHVNTCSHTGGKYTSTRRGECIGGEFADWLYHIETCRILQYTYCSDCYDILGEPELLEEVERSYQVHNYNDESVCTVCGFVCEHSHFTERGEFQGERTYTTTGLAEHVAKGTYVIFKTCRGCHKVEETTIENYETTEPHQYYDGQCLKCGQENTCDHANTEKRKVYEWTEYEWKNNQVHTCSRYYTEYLYCTACGVQLDYIDDGYDETEEPHDFEATGYCWICADECEHVFDADGHCENCGYQCLHPGTNENWIDRSTYDELPTNNREHLYHYAWQINTVCYECGKVMATRTETNGDYKQDHDYDENGKCTQCEHVNTCTHVHTYESFYLTDPAPTYTAVDNRYHNATGNGQFSTYCQDCWMTYNRHEGIGSSQYMHEYNADGVCTICNYQNTCEHLNVAEYSQITEWPEDDAYKPVDETYHEAPAIGRTYKRCGDCGMEFDIHEGVQLVARDTHDYYNGVCEVCKYACQHAKGRRHGGRYTGEVTYTPIDRNTHEITGTYHSYEYCPDCYLRFNEKDEVNTSRETHDFEDGKCLQCQFVCAHDQPLVHEGEFVNWNQVQYRSLDEREHEVTGEYINYDWCPICEKHFNETRETKTLAYAHNFIDGVCEDCNFTCQHSGKWLLGSTYRYVPDTSFEVVDGQYHSRLADFTTYEYCSNCHVRRNEETTRKAQKNRHNYEDGTCTQCGYECQHADGFVHTGYFTDNGQATITSVGADGHNVTGDYFEYDYCPDCDYQKNKTYSIQTKLYSHDYSYGLCTTCGYECQHPRGMSHAGDYIDWKLVTYEPINSDEHSVTGDYREFDFCTICNWRENDVTATKTETEDHHFQNGVCRECEYVCNHAKGMYETGCFVDGEQIVCEPIDASSHKLTGMYKSYKRCRICDMHFDEKVEERTRTYYHDYNNGVCTECGYTCQHDGHTFKFLGRVEDSEPIYEQCDDMSHWRTRQVEVVELCEFCDEVLSRTPKGERTSIEHHYYEDSNVCVECGYVNTCAHEHEYIEYWWVKEDDTTVYESVDNCWHTVTGKTLNGIYCADCGEWLREEPGEVRTETREHEYGDDGVCYLCHHVREACDHVHTRTYNESFPEYTLYDDDLTDDYQHTGTGYVRRYLVCTDCGEYLSEERVFDLTYSEEHIYYGTCGICSWCDHMCGHPAKEIHDGVCGLCGKRGLSVSPTAVTLDMTTATLLAGEKLTLTATILPANADADTELTWTTSNEAVATVTNAGEVKAIAKGTATITVSTANGKTATCEITVPTAPTAVTLNKTSATVVVGDNLTLKATLTPADAQTTYTWTSSNKAVATVTDNGVVKALKMGTATITVKTANGKKATCKIAVPKPPTAVKLNKTTATVVVGDNLTLKATLTPTDAKTTYIWTSSNKGVATVTANGVVKALKMGTATITVKTANGKKATCKITVPKPPTAVKLNKTTATVVVGDNLTLKATLTPTDAKTTYTWTSSNKGVATVTANGVVKALKKGTATITVKTANGKKATCKITVPKPPTAVKFAKTSYTVQKGKTITLKPILTPTDAKTTYTWTSKNKKIATVTKKGVVKGIAKGTTEITVKTANGKTKTVKIIVK